MGQRLSFQQKTKHISKQCQICDLQNYDLLDVHRIVPGKDGGKYTPDNTIAVCCSCHRKIHAGTIVVEGKYHSTAGIVVHYFENGNEHWKREK